MGIAVGLEKLLYLLLISLRNWAELFFTIIYMSNIILMFLRGVYRIVHKKLERKCERKACKYKEFERFEGDLGKKNEMYTGLICFNLV